MNIRLPKFAKHSEWGMQSHPEFPCVLLKDALITSADPLCQRRYECRADGVLRFVVAPHYMLLKAGYACDGSSCSPDVADDPVLGDNMLAAFFHDAGYQFSEVPVFRRMFPRSLWDGLHLEIMRQRKFKVRWIYYACLRACGWWNFGARRNSGATLTVVEADRREDAL